LEEVWQRPGHPIQTVTHQDVIGIIAEISQRTGKDWPVRSGAGGNLGEYPITSGSTKYVDLGIKVLFRRGLSSITYQHPDLRS
jgi:hypothetical protein